MQRCITKMYCCKGEMIIFFVQRNFVCAWYWNTFLLTAIKLYNYSCRLTVPFFAKVLSLKKNAGFSPLRAERWWLVVIKKHTCAVTRVCWHRIWRDAKDTHRPPLRHGPVAFAGRASAVFDVRWFCHWVTWSGLVRAADVAGHLRFAATFSGTLREGGAHGDTFKLVMTDTFS